MKVGYWIGLNELAIVAVCEWNCMYWTGCCNWSTIFLPLTLFIEKNQQSFILGWINIQLTENGAKKKDELLPGIPLHKLKCLKSIPIAASTFYQGSLKKNRFRFKQVLSRKISICNYALSIQNCLIDIFLTRLKDMLF